MSGCCSGSCGDFQDFGPPASNNGTNFANRTITEISQAIPRIAELLKISPNEIKILEQWGFPAYHNSTYYTDHVVKAIGLTKDLPFLQCNKLHTRKIPAGYGLILYECRGKPDLNYVCYSTKDGSGYQVIFYACKSGTLAKIVRNNQRLAKLANKNIPPILREGLLDDVIKSSIHFLLNSKQIEKYGVRIKRGILLDGPPGNGKTMTCRYLQRLCTDNDIMWGVVNASDIDKAYNDNNLEQLFNRYTVTFFDDIDISYLSRKAGNGKVACSILSSMDGMCDAGHTIRVFTTNERIDDLDPAFIRPGRIDRRFIFDKPNDNLRGKLLTIWPTEIIENIDCQLLVAETNGNSFADLEAIRANLVTNFLFGDNTWNLHKAIHEFHEGCGSFNLKNKTTGFYRNSDNAPCDPAQRLI